MEGHVIIEGQRRRVWPDELKRQIVEESYDRDTTVLEVGRRHEVDPAQIYAWRKKFTAEVPEPTRSFLPVEIGTASSAPEERLAAASAATERLEISFPDGCRLFLPAETPVKKVAALMEAMRS
ncbi:IS66-like element accessory protein TnpA [Parvularcula oceani]|uniref:IS66-like element accessory protein TnpA n=1 Tax=Parvularcula oceani TaxID=1247963 RepID=UPI00068E01D3|nr:transposase [Parvularcula oceani]